MTISELLEDRIAQLKAELADLKAQRACREMSDDYAYTNGTIKGYDEAIREVERKIKALTE
jgi:hypothetical protein